MNMTDAAHLANISPTMTVVELTPQLAESLLKQNISNRPLDTRYAARVANAIRRGEWKLNGDTIRVSRSGRLLDGQHRCTAVVQAGVSVTTMMVLGLDDEVFETIDRGRARTTSDTLAIKGEAYSTALAAITRILHIYSVSGEPYNGNPDHQPTAAQQLAILEANPKLRESAQWVGVRTWVRKFINPSLAGFCHFLFTRADAEAARTFFDGLETGAGLDAGSPVLLLRNRLSEATKDKGRLTNTYKAGLIFKAFKLHRDGASIKTLRVRTEGDCPERDVFVL